jgi:transcriptional regulator with XRE-family HTH domain
VANKFPRFLLLTIDVMKPAKNIGEKIRQKMEERGMKVADFAVAIARSRQNTYNILQRKKIDVELLQRISAVLHHDFLHQPSPKKQAPQKYIVIGEVTEQKLPEVLQLMDIKYKQRLSA